MAGVPTPPIFGLKKLTNRIMYMGSGIIMQYDGTSELLSLYFWKEAMLQKVQIDLMVNFSVLG